MKKLLVVVDYQKDFVDGALGFIGAEGLEKPILERIESYVVAGDEVIYTLDTHLTNYLETTEGKHLPVEHCILETEGHLTVNEQPKVSKTKKEEINSPSSVEQLSLLMEEE